MKKKLTVPVLLALLIFALSAQSFAEEETYVVPDFYYSEYDDGATDDGFLYEIDEEGCATITGYRGISPTVTVPAEIDGCAVKYIGKNSFTRNEYIVSLTVPGNVERIGEEAFADCVNIVSVTLEAGVTEIGEEAFRGCKLLSELTLSEGLKRIGHSAFDGCLMLREIKMPASLEEIGEEAFLGCENLKLDCSQSAYAAEYAAKNSIRLNTDMTRERNAAIIAATLIAAAGGWWLWRRKSSRSAK